MSEQRLETKVGPEPASASADVNSRFRLSRGLRKWRNRGKAPFVLVILGVIWVTASWAIPSGVATPAETYRGIAHGIDRGWMQSGLAATMRATFTAFLISATVGITLSMVLALARFWGDVFEPMLLWMYSVPKITLFPVVMLFFGISVEATTAFGVLNGLLPVIIITFGAMRAVPSIHLRVAEVYGLGRWQILREVLMPVAAPSVVTAARYGFSTAFLAVIVAEMFASRQGLGNELFRAIALHDLGQLFGIAFVLTAIAVVVNAAFMLISKIAFGGTGSAALVAPPAV